MADVVRVGTMTAQLGKEAALLAFAQRIIMPALQSAAGCISCELLQQTDEANTLMIVERWESVDAHVASARNIPPEAIKEVMGLLAGPPVGAYYRSVQPDEFSHD